MEGEYRGIPRVRIGVDGKRLKVSGGADGVAEGRGFGSPSAGGRSEVVLQNPPRYAALYLKLIVMAGDGFRASGETQRRRMHHHAVFSGCRTSNRLNSLPGLRIRAPFGENLMLSYLEFDRDAVVPFHSHPHEQGGIVLQGKIELTIGDDARIVGPGRCTSFPQHPAPRRVRGWSRGGAGCFQPGAGGLRGKIQQIYSPGIAREEMNQRCRRQILERRMKR